MYLLMGDHAEDPGGNIKRNYWEYTAKLRRPAGRNLGNSWEVGKSDRALRALTSAPDSITSASHLSMISQTEQPF
jgi:hypothetical protein